MSKTPRVKEPPCTIHRITNIIKQSFESEEPQHSILNILREYDGVNLTGSITTRMRQEIGDPCIRIHRTRHLTSIRWRWNGFLKIHPGKYRAIINIKEIERINWEVLGGVKLRNRQRESLLQDPQSLELLHQAISLYNHNGGIIQELLRGKFSGDAEKLETLLQHVTL